MRITTHRFLLLACCCVFFGCTGTSAKLNRVSIGMTKAEVIRSIGTPDSTSASDGREYLIYHLASPKALVVDPRDLTHYYIRLTSGRVDAYGEQGDAPSTGSP